MTDLPQQVRAFMAQRDQSFVGTIATDLGADPRKVQYTIEHMPDLIVNGVTLTVVHNRQADEFEGAAV